MRKLYIHLDSNEKMVPIDEYNAFNIKISDVFCNSIDYIYKMVWGKLFKTSIAKKLDFPLEFQMTKIDTI